MGDPPLLGRACTRLKAEGSFPGLPDRWHAHAIRTTPHSAKENFDPTSLTPGHEALQLVQKGRIVKFIDMIGVPETSGLYLLPVATTAEPILRRRIEQRLIEITQQRNRIPLDPSPHAVRPGLVVDAHPQERKTANDATDFALQGVLVFLHFAASRFLVAPCRIVGAISAGHRDPDEKPEDRTPMIAAAGAELPSVLRQAPPQFRSRTCFQVMSSDPDDPRAFAAVGTLFTGLAKKINATPGPLQASRAIRQSPGAARCFSQACPGSNKTGPDLAAAHHSCVVTLDAVGTAGSSSPANRLPTKGRQA